MGKFIKFMTEYLYDFSLANVGFMCYKWHTFVFTKKIFKGTI